jgi:hypothetical protein
MGHSSGSEPARASRRQRLRRAARHPHPRGRGGPIATADSCSTRCSPSSASSPAEPPTVADAYYAAQIVAGLLKENNHLLTRVKSNAVAYTAHQQRGLRKRGRLKIYGKVKLSSCRKTLGGPPAGRHSPVYGERRVVIQYKVRDLLWRLAGRFARFVAVIHPTRGSPPDVHRHSWRPSTIRLYGLRSKSNTRSSRRCG